MYAKYSRRIATILEFDAAKEKMISCTQQQQVSHPFKEEDPQGFPSRQFIVAFFKSKVCKVITQVRGTRNAFCTCRYFYPLQS